MGAPEFNGEYHSSRGYYTGSKDGENETIGSKSDLEAGQDLSQPWSLVSTLKGILSKLRGVIFVTLAGSKAVDHIFHESAVEIANGTPFNVGGYKTLTVEISGASTERTISFIGRGQSGEDRYIAGVKLSDLSLATGTTGNGELWQFDITGLNSVIMDLTAVVGGNVTVKGRAVA